MWASFYRTSRALNGDRNLLTIAGLILAVSVLGGWVAWATGAPVARYEVSNSARIELDSAVYPLQARVAGRVASAHLELGRPVQAGEILVELETESQRLSLAEERTRYESLSPQIEALKAQIGVQDEGRQDDRQVLNVAVDEARARYRDAQAQWEEARLAAERAQKLRAEKILAEADFQKALASERSKRAIAESLELEIGKLHPEARVREIDRSARRKQILSDIGKIEAEMASSAAAIRRLEYEIERRSVRAPVAGRLADSLPLRQGAYVSESDRLGAILPAGGLRAVAEFLPASAMGRIRPGQSGAIRLDGYPWAQYGTVPARVAHVADEIRDGRIRVEFTLLAQPGSRIPLRHGLPGAVEVEVERVTPAALVLRTAGRMVAGQ